MCFVPELGNVVEWLRSSVVGRALGQILTEPFGVDLPDEVIERDDTSSASTLRFEGVEAIPCTDVEDTPARERRQREPLKLVGQDLRGLRAAGDDPIAEIDRVPPVADRSHGLLLARSAPEVHAGNHSSSCGRSA